MNAVVDKRILLSYGILGTGASDSIITRDGQGTTAVGAHPFVVYGEVVDTQRQGASWIAEKANLQGVHSAVAVVVGIDGKHFGIDGRQRTSARIKNRTAAGAVGGITTGFCIPFDQDLVAGISAVGIQLAGDAL